MIDASRNFKIFPKFGVGLCRGGDSKPLKANPHRVIPLSQGIDKIIRVIQIMSIKLNPTQNGGQLKVDQLSNFDRLPFHTEVTYTPVSYRHRWTSFHDGVCKKVSLENGNDNEYSGAPQNGVSALC